MVVSWLRRAGSERIKLGWQEGVPLQLFRMRKAGEQRSYPSLGQCSQFIVWVLFFPLFFWHYFSNPTNIQFPELNSVIHIFVNVPIMMSLILKKLLFAKIIDLMNLIYDRNFSFIAISST